MTDLDPHSDLTRCEPVLACIALGSNIETHPGGRAETIASAVRAIADLPQTILKAASEPIETEPVGPTGQGPFLNSAVSVMTTLGARTLLDSMLDIERAHGRERGQRWGPRILDLDLILYGSEIIDDPGLAVPHPLMTQRRFVLEPLASIEPDVVEPMSGLCILKLLDRLDQAEQQGLA